MVMRVLAFLGTLWSAFNLVLGRSIFRGGRGGGRGPLEVPCPLLEKGPRLYHHQTRGPGGADCPYPKSSLRSPPKLQQQSLRRTSTTRREKHVKFAGSLICDRDMTEWYEDETCFKQRMQQIRKEIKSFRVGEQRRTFILIAFLFLVGCGALAYQCQRSHSL